MKIVAAINRRAFLVEMNEDEIVRAAGYGSTYDAAWEKANGGRDIKVDTVIKVNNAYDFHARVSNFHTEAEKSARTLRALADMIDGALPDVVIPPPEEGIFDNEAWIVWNGQEKPYLHDDTLVEVQKRNGDLAGDCVKNFRWSHSSFSSTDFHSDIIRYRVVRVKEGGAA